VPVPILSSATMLKKWHNFYLDLNANGEFLPLDTLAVMALKLASAEAELLMNFFYDMIVFCIEG